MAEGGSGHWTGFLRQNGERKNFTVDMKLWAGSGLLGTGRDVDNGGHIALILTLDDKQ